VVGAVQRGYLGTPSEGDEDFDRHLQNGRQLIRGRARRRRRPNTKSTANIEFSKTIQCLVSNIYSSLCKVPFVVRPVIRYFQILTVTLPNSVGGAEVEFRHGWLCELTCVAEVSGSSSAGGLDNSSRGGCLSKSVMVASDTT
jgi:hypothetical protein